MRGSSSTPGAEEPGSKDGPRRDEIKIEVNDPSKEADAKNEKQTEGTEVAKAASPANYGVCDLSTDQIWRAAFAEQGTPVESSLIWNEERRRCCHADGSDLLYGIWNRM